MFSQAGSTSKVKLRNIPLRLPLKVISWAKLHSREILSNDKNSSEESDDLYSSCNRTGLNPKKSLILLSGMKAI